MIVSGLDIKKAFFNFNIKVMFDQFFYGATDLLSKKKCNCKLYEKGKVTLIKIFFPS